VNIYIFDIECYINYFLLNFIDYTTKKQYSLEINENTNNLKEIVKFTKVKNTTYVGHNILGYDNLLLNYIVQNRKELVALENLEICSKIKDISDKIINRKRNEQWSDELLELLNFENFNCIDTLALMNTIDRVGIKQASINLKYNNVQELPYAPESILTLDEQQNVKDYCFNDCNISLLLYEKKLPDIELRKDITERYGVDVSNCNDTAIAKKILNKYYSEYTNLPVKSFKDLRSFNKPFKLEEVVPLIEFKTKPFQDLYQWFKNQEVTEKTEILVDEEDKEVKKTKIFYDLRLPNIVVRFAFGGLHSIDLPKKFVTTELKELTDFDFNSYYPNLLINYNVKPRHVKPEFIQIVKTLTLERIKDKQEGRKKDADIKKIVINSIYGLLGSEYYWLRDKKALLKITVTGQLWLAKLLEELYLNEIEVISMNTDGILSYVDVHKKDKYEEICNSISKQVNIEGEYSYYKEYIRKDVNNYLSIDLNSKTKEKGKYFATEIQLSKGYYYPIIGKALREFYLNNIPIENTILNEPDIYNFMSSQKVDVNKFEAVLQTFENNEINKQQLQKINRWIVTKKGGKFLKVEKDAAKLQRLQKKKEELKAISIKDRQNKIIGVEVDSFVTILNNVKDTNAKNYDLDYKFYINICNEIINAIEPKVQQLALF
jgi:DNA polymerase elongation subunit (family B)